MHAKTYYVKEEEDIPRSLNVTYGDLAPGSYNATMAKLERRLVHGLHSIS